MKANWKHVLMVALAVALAAPLTPAQSQSQGQQPPKPPAQGQNPPAPPAPTPAEPAAPPVNEEEEKAYKAFYDLPKTENQRTAEAGEDFLKKFPESRYKEAVFTKLVNTYLSLEQIDKMYQTGEKALELNPNNADVLAVVSWAVPRRWDAKALGAQEQLTKVEGYGKKAIEVIEAMPKPETMTEEDFTKAKADKLSMAHSGLGVVHYHRQRFADMATELETATKLSTSPDPVDFYLLAIAYQQVRRFGDAATAYEKCSEAGPVTAQCKSGAATAKKMAAAMAPKQ